MLIRFAVFLFGASLFSAMLIAQSGQQQTPPASQNPPPAQAIEPSPQQQQDSTTGPAAEPAKALQPKSEPGHWKKIKVVPDKRHKTIPAGTLDQGTPA